ncbi:MAG: hypothetical protein ACK5NW_08185 [Ottowia sp.]
MNSYSYIVSLRANHPFHNLSYLSSLLSLERRSGWTADEARVTPKGTVLNERRSESYWSARITPTEMSSEEQELEDVLDQSVSTLLRLSDRLADFYATGGTLNYFIGLYGACNYGLAFPVSLAQKLADAKIEVQLDIYPYESGCQPTAPPDNA